MSQAINGMTTINKKEIPLSFDIQKELLTVYTGQSSVEIPEGLDVIVSQSFGMLTGGMSLFKLSVPLSNDCLAIDGAGAKNVAISNQIRGVEYHIDDYKGKSTYSEMRLRFPELNYLLPSSGIAKLDDKFFVFSRELDTLCSFDIKYRGRSISVAFVRGSEAKASVNATTETFSEMRLKFSGTDDLDFITNLYYSVRGFFEFINNRKNIGLRSAVLIGEYPKKTIENEKIVDATGYTKQIIFFSQKYLEPLEEEKIIKKTPKIGLFIDKLQNLLQLFLEEKDDEMAIVNGSSCHPSIKYRNLIDLEQSLHITAVFEYYVRTLLPEISSQETIEFLNDIAVLVDGYIASATGKKRKKAKDFKKSLKPQISLEEKVLKVYGGYENWNSLQPILTEWFGEDVSELASAANLWRNELAHEKREYQPDLNVITAVRLVEHLNYCIILRHAGYSDEAIKAILSEVLTR